MSILTLSLGEFVPDSQAITTEYFNVVSASGLALGFGSGLSSIMNPAAGPVTSPADLLNGGFLYYQSPNIFGITEGSQDIIFAQGKQSGTTAKVYTAEPGDLTFSHDPVNVLNVSGTRRPFLQWGEKVIHAPGDGIEPYMWFPISGEFNSFVTSSRKFVGAFLGQMYNHVIFAGINSDTLGQVGANGIAWSALDDAADWDASLVTGAGNQLLVDIPGPISGAFFDQYGLVFKRTGIFLMTYEGHPFTFSFRVLANGIGTVHPRSIVSSGNAVYFLGLDGFKRIDKGLGITTIGKGKIDWFFRSVGSENAILSDKVGFFSGDDNKSPIGVYDHSTGMVMWWYATRDCPHHYNNACIMYEEVTDRWFFHKEDDNNIRIIDAFSGPWINVTAAGDRFVSPMSMTALATTNSAALVTTVAPLNGQTAKYARISTNTIQLSQENSIFVRGVRVLQRYSDQASAVNSMTVKANYYNDPFKLSGVNSVTSSTPTENGWFPFQFDAQYIDLEISSPVDTVPERAIKELFAIQIDADFGGQKGV